MKSFKRVYQCDCHDFHFMMVEGNREFSGEVFLSVGGAYWDSWRKRVKVAWACLRGGEYSVYETILNPEDVFDLQEALREFCLGKGK